MFRFLFCGSEYLGLLGPSISDLFQPKNVPILYIKISKSLWISHIVVQHYQDHSSGSGFEVDFGVFLESVLVLYRVPELGPLLNPE
jgi:hypothetical protein